MATIDTTALDAALREINGGSLKARLTLRGYAPAGFGCWARPGSLPITAARALDECDAALDDELRALAGGAAGQLVARDQVGESEEQAAEQGSAGVHRTPSTAEIQSVRCEP